MTSSANSQHSEKLRENVSTACANLGKLLINQKYALVGGAACQVLGSDRITEDVDFVVPKNCVSNARKLLAADESKQFTVDKRTLHTHHEGLPRVEIEILSPPGTFKETFDEDTLVLAVLVKGTPVSVLHPTLLLNAKCRSILGRATQDKKMTDAADIKFLLKYLAADHLYPTSSSLPNVSKMFVDWFVGIYAQKELWDDIKYDATTGTFKEA